MSGRLGLTSRGIHPVVTLRTYILAMRTEPSGARPLPAIRLFSGAGGRDLGLARAGSIEFRAWVEVDPDARATLKENDPAILPGALFADIEDVTPSELMSVADVKAGETFLLAGGPPCQAFSTAGLRQALNDDSGRVVRNYFDMVKSIRPRFFVFENVRGLLSAALIHRPLVERRHPKEVPTNEDARLGSVLNRFMLPRFRRLGYEVVLGILNAADYGTAQVRHRVVILGSREHEFGSVVFRKQTSQPMRTLDLIPVTHHRFVRHNGIQAWRSLKDTVGALASQPLDPHDAYTYSPERAAVFARIPPGRNWKFLRDHQRELPRGYLRKVMGEAALRSGGGKEGFYRRLSWDGPAPTLTAQPQQLASSLCHPDFERPLSIPEYAALQDFSSTHQFMGSKSSRYRQIGNAVPVRLGEAIGRSILAIAGEHVT